jgi:hypothetical protein
MNITCTNRELTYAQIRHIVLEEAAQAILDDTVVVQGEECYRMNAQYFANKLRQMRHEGTK